MGAFDQAAPSGRAAEDRIETDERFREQRKIKIAYRQML
jgi:hypothetical protein